MSPEPTCPAKHVTIDGRRFVCKAPPHPDIPSAHYYVRDHSAAMSASAAPNNHHLESSLEAFFRNEVRKLGGMCIKLVPTVRGIPDRLVIMPWGQTIFVELKADSGKLSEIQKVRHSQLRSMKQNVVVLQGRVEIVKWIATTVDAAGPQFRERRSKA